MKVVWLEHFFPQGLWPSTYLRKLFFGRVLSYGACRRTSLSHLTLQRKGRCCAWSCKCCEFRSQGSVASGGPCVNCYSKSPATRGFLAVCAKFDVAGTSLYLLFRFHPIVDFLPTFLVLTVMLALVCLLLDASTFLHFVLAHCDWDYFKDVWCSQGSLWPKEGFLFTVHFRFISQIGLAETFGSLTLLFDGHGQEKFVWSQQASRSHLFAWTKR